jgi:hypothetical protein
VGHGVVVADCNVVLIFCVVADCNVVLIFCVLADCNVVLIFCVSVIKTGQLMLYREIMTVCSQIHTKHINSAVWVERRILEC